jgi:hypothetical protein
MKSGTIHSLRCTTCIEPIAYNLDQLQLELFRIQPVYLFLRVELPRDEGRHCAARGLRDTGWKQKGAAEVSPRGIVIYMPWESVVLR